MAERYSQEWCDRLHNQLDVKIKSVEDTIYGNGHEGLLTRMSKMEQDMPVIKSDVKSMMKWLWMGLGVVAILQPVLVAFLIKSIVHSKL